MDDRRLNKYLADSGYCSRREADRLITEGRVKVNGALAALGTRVKAGDSVTVNGRALDGAGKKVYIALNKPRGIVCTADPREPMNVVSYMDYPVRIYPIGRLDKDSEGLLLLTSDGDIVNRLLRAAGGHEKEYQVEVDKPITPEFLTRMASGVPILDRVTMPCKIKRTAPRAFEIVLVQGLNRQIRRMCEYLGYTVTHLRRVRVMNILLGDMRPGDWRELTADEVSELMNALDNQ